ncbi:MAG TPA: hypothetical protein VMJ34_21305 [Bryobacteraceae bacterium]|nr:hypothetical protein [Bryobacteraceae bacterium]
MRFCVVALLLNALALAETPVRASDLVGMMTEDLAVDRNDARMARGLGSVRLTEQLSGETVEMLQRMGVGRRTLHELRSMSHKSAGLPAPAQPPLSLDPQPSPAERAAMIESMRRYAASYLANLPDFMCVRDAREFRTKILVPFGGTFGATALIPADERRWRAHGSYTAEASYVGGSDHYRLTLEDGRPTTKTFEQLQRKVSSGEFAGAMKEVFSSGPSFRWDRWETIGGLRTVVFTYYVDPEHSGYWLCCPRFVTAHRGFVYADPQSGAIWRIVIYATGLKGKEAVSAAGHVVDYGEVLIGGNRYLLPEKSAAYNRTSNEEWREDVVYRDYRKFGSDATVAFPTADEPAKPAPAASSNHP